MKRIKYIFNQVDVVLKNIKSIEIFIIFFKIYIYIIKLLIFKIFKIILNIIILKLRKLINYIFNS